MDIEVLPTAGAVAKRAAEWLAGAARDCVRRRGRFTLAFSGGSTPIATLRALAREDVPWQSVQLFQVDERVAPDGSPHRNATQLRSELLDHIPLPPSNLHLMAVGDPDLPAAARSYARTLTDMAGSPAVLDVVQLGLGLDGHTASLAPGDPVLEVTSCDVAQTNRFAGHRRLTLTFPALNRARQILWLVTGAQKARVLRQLTDGEASIPAGRVDARNATLIADAAARP